MKLQKHVLVAALSAVVGTAFTPLAARAQSAAEVTIEIVVDIDGRSQLILHGNTAQWHHLDFAAPGREQGTNFPTSINDLDWYPVWPDEPNAENRDCDCLSDVFTHVEPPLPAQPMTVGLQVVSIVRQDYPGSNGGLVTIVQFPTRENDFTIVVEFDDNELSGSAFYDVRLLARTLPNLTVPVDIKPGSDPNAINPGSRGLVPVAILTTDALDAADLPPSTVRFGPNGAAPMMPLGRLADVDGDGDLDLVVQFPTQATGIQCGDTRATLTGKTRSGQDIQGTDGVLTVGCRQ
jgi:hypothetical protein